MKALRILLMDINRVSLDTSNDMLEYPLGLLYVATSLKHAFGDRVEILIESYDEKGDPWEKVENLMDGYRPDLLGLRSLTMGRKSLHRVATVAREKYQIPFVVAGGPHATDSPDDVLHNEAFDCAVLGEGEETAIDLVSRILLKQSLDSMPGLALRSSEGVSITPSRPPIEDLDRLPMPDYRLIDFQRINKGHVDFSFRYDVPHANLFTSRGCPYRCIYCHHIFGKRFRAHTPERIMAEVNMLHDQYGITRFQIIDDIFNIDRDRTMRFLEMVIRSGKKLTFSFPNGVRGDRVDEEMVDAMWEAGVRYIAYAIESGAPRIQKLIQKDLDLNRIKEAISLSTAKGILTRGFFMLGFPTEMEEEAMMTIDFAKSSDLVQAMFFTVVYFPGTPLFQLARKMCKMSDLDLGLEDDYVHTREGPYAFSRETLQSLKLKAIREFFFSSRRLNLTFDIMPNFYNQRDIDASILVNIISGKMGEKEIEDPGNAERLHRYFLVANRFSKKSGFFV